MKTEQIAYFDKLIQQKLENLPRAIEGKAPVEILEKICQELRWLKEAKEQLLIHSVVSSSVEKELLIAELDDKRCIGVEMNEDMWYLCRKETAQHLLDNYNITPK